MRSRGYVGLHRPNGEAREAPLPMTAAQLLTGIDAPPLDPDAQAFLRGQRPGSNVAALLAIRKDPFGRLMVAQAQALGLVLVTRDSWVQHYDVDWLAA